MTEEERNDAPGLSPDDSSTPDDSQAEEEGSRISYVHTKNLPELFDDLGLSLFVTTYQAGRILLFSQTERKKINMLMRKLPRPTGLALAGPRLAVASRHQVWVFRAFTGMRSTKGEEYPYDLAFVPRRSHVTGYIDSHQIQWIGKELWAVNTHYSCLCTFDEDWSFRPRWMPSFVTELAPEDRCHLNGMCLDQSGIKYVSALGKTNTKEGWRENKAKGGIVIDVPSGEVITEGLSMPHSPKIYGGYFFILESETVELLVIDQKTGKAETAMKFAGFLRGLSFHGKYAFIGLCKAREKKSFGNLPVVDEFDDLQCGVSVVDLEKMAQVAFIQFQGGVEELFDIAVLPNAKNPFLIGFEDKLIDQTKIVPPKEHWGEMPTFSSS